ncbi:MAG: hypothetical protein KDB79_07260 [Acidobacteria bacterium]|nr:hypothetical protein [Acidobacteriota bacterium]
MFTSNNKKFLFAILGLVLFSSTCRFFQREKPLVEKTDLPKQSAPFPTKEPDIFQTEIIVSTFFGQTRSEKKYFLAKKDGATLYVFNYGEKDETAILEKADGKSFVLKKGAKTFAPRGKKEGAAETGDLQHFLTTKWLNEKKTSKFEDLGAKNGLRKYRVTIDDNSGSEIFVFFDEKLKIPVKQEFYSATGGQKQLSYTVELKNIKTEADAKLFEIPAGYRPADGSVEARDTP